MFKRLAKARRHSSDEVGASLPPTPMDEPPGNAEASNKFLDVPIHQAFNPAILRGSRFKYARRSCGDATAIQSMMLNDETGIGTRVEVDNDYQTVTAVPAFIVEHEPEKTRGLSVWGRRMSKKIESFRRAGSRESVCAFEREDTVNNNNHENNNNNNNNSDKSPDNRKNDGKLLSRRSPSPFKSFFIRMGSTGMLNSTKAMRRSSNCDDRLKTADKKTLLRSCSTSQLNTSPTYVKGDDPSEGIDLQIAHRKDKTMSCDNLADNHDDDVFEEVSMTSSSRRSSSSGFGACDFSDARNDSLRKSSSCDFKETKRCNFPYAFLRSKLSVLPEERNGAVQTKEDRLFKATSEEHFPVLKIDESFDGTTTLGRRRSKHTSGDNPQTPRFSRNSYAEYRGRASSNLGKCEPDRYSLNPSNLERMEDTFKREDRCYSPFIRPSRGVHPTLTESSTESSDYTCIDNYRLSEAFSLGAELDVIATLRNHRRNSAPCPEQRLSSHYVSSNESGYDSDGAGRGESTTTFENEISSKCADSSDTSSVIDSELEKPMRSSTPSECREVTSNLSVKTIKPRCMSDMNEGIDGLRWHQSTSGRLLPSIHQGSYDDTPSNRLSLCSDRLEGIKVESQVDRTPPHRVRLQQDKRRFLSDIIHPPRRVRRCRVVQLARMDGRDSLGIRLAQHNAGDIKYIVVQLENDGIAHRDGRLRLGDEIVEVEGKELRTLKTLEEVQEFLKSFTSNKVRLTTAYEETVPEGYTETPVISKGFEHLENARNLSNASQMDNQRQCDASDDRIEEDKQLDGVERKRPNYLPLTCIAKSRKDPVEPTPDADQYLMRHVARFEKGIGKPSLGFSVVGGRDSPRGEMGIFVRRVFPGGQADSSKALLQGDEILCLNGKQLRGCTHQEVIELFKAVREGVVELEIARRHRYPKTTLKSAP
ncbi:uncharacterized protein [Fopius arisanus]|uniref:PDZ domain-containing protein n=2 Tax=Fopius arisanus TaxID=64838 RepID=A0A9R1T0X2_9HYME|nr:PREDICTED: uncharacterized protein LOC105265094 [Fopius arisanus]XP_011300698.1 PREDICTED: uncharacterized protein LOC105265094 [Fopius arisanus]